MASTRNWLRLPFVYRDRAKRGFSPALVAVHWNGTTPRQVQIANISNSGAYLLTDEKWALGEIVSLTLQRGGAVQPSNRKNFTVQARTVRRDSKGVAVSFLLPRGETSLWEGRNGAPPSSQPEDVVREFRMAGALSFLRRIAPGAIDRTRNLLRFGLSSHRQEAALEIALHAEELLTLSPSKSRHPVDTDLLIRILEDGSWADTDWIQHYWSGLLASSCTDSDELVPDMECPSLLSQLTTMQARIFAASCDGARKFVDHNGQLCAHRFTRSADDLAQISGTHDRVHIERDVQHLADLGLVEPQVKWKFFALIDEADITPTALAIKLYARCHAFSGNPAAFFETSTLTESAMCAD